MNFLKKRKLSLSFKIIFIIIIILTVSLSITFHFMGKRYERLILSQIKSQARILFKQIIVTRKWVANHGGVFVEQTLKAKSNPYLETSVITDVIGKRYIKENPAFVTRELSEYARKEGVFWYHITSLNLVNPANAPDEFEKNALEKFNRERDVREFYKIEQIEDHNLFRYIAPLYIELECMKCHAKHGYNVGDIRGAISVTLPVDNVFELIKTNKRNTIIITYIILAIITLFLFFSMNLIIIKPINRLTGQIKNFAKKKRLSEERIKSYDEIEDLSKEFIKMAEEISMYHDSLDNKVQDATKNLQDLNDKLSEANKKLEEMNIKKSDFIASVSHEMRTPLTSIRGAMDYILERIKTIDTVGKDNDFKEFFDILKNNIHRLTTIVNDTIDLERVELGKVEMHIKPTELTSLINDTIKGLIPILSEKELKVRFNYEGKMEACVDEDRIKQVLINLINNAINFSPYSETIEIKSYRENGWVITEIIDNGPGIKVEEREQIFKRYYKKGSHRGSGLGLTICKGIVEAHNGEIGFNNNKSKGSTFYFKIPIIDNEEDTCS